MDILTQGLLGGVLAQSVANKEETKLATLIGVIAGLLADADIFIYSSNDPLLNIEFHRHFTHSLFFIPFGAAIAMALLWPFLKNRLPVRRLYLYSLLGYSMSGLLDACTSYGTHLLWPFSDERIAFNVISIIDPLFTLSLFIALLYSLRVKRQRIAHIGLLVAVAYMLIGYIQLQRATNVAENLMASRGHQSTKVLVKPTLGNLVLWRSVYIYQDKIYVDAVRVGLLAENKVFEGESVDKLSVKTHLSSLEQPSVLYNDVQRFSVFSDGFVAINPIQKNIIGDLRYSMLPTSIKPLWGIVVDIDNPHEHADYKFFRDSGKDIRKEFVNMLMWSEN